MFNLTKGTNNVLMEMIDGQTPRYHAWEEVMVPVLGAFGAMTILLLS
jgi:hypothetical protein